jgi:SAM-dependent methyltransferase
MLGQNYDAAIRQHYDRVAETDGLSPTSTMADEVVRAKETAVIVDFIDQARRLTEIREADLTIIDVGCGNGYTLSKIVERYPSARCIGIEQNDKLRALAVQRSLNVVAGDVRRPLAGDVPAADIVICQRVLINLLDPADQRTALDHIVSVAKPDGHLLFIEAFRNTLERLNEARAEFGMAAIPPAVHNLPLPDGFFSHPGIRPAHLGDFPHSEHELSTHYFVTRVLHDLALDGRPFMRNSHFVRFLSEALPPGVGEFSPIRFKWFTRYR